MPELWNQKIQWLLGSGSANKAIAKQRLSRRHMMTAKHTQHNKRAAGSGVFYTVRSVRWLAACEDVSPGAEEHPLLQHVKKHHGEDCHWDC
jgi:hypothetical protein